MHFYPTERIALFIDGANLYATAKALGFDIDYKRLLALFRTKGQLVRAQYYTALAEDQEYSSIRPLVDWLDYNGYTMVTKPTKEFTDSFGRRKIKGNMDIELTVDAMRLAEPRPCGYFHRRRRLQGPRRCSPAGRTSRERHLHSANPAADGRRRTAAAGRSIHRSCRPRRPDLPRPCDASGARTARGRSATCARRRAAAPAACHAGLPRRRRRRRPEPA